MKIKLYLTFLLISLNSFFSFSQDFKKGYYIDTNKNRNEVLFKMTDFTDPTALKIKNTENDDYQKLDLGKVVEFGIDQDYKFVKRVVKHDQNFSGLSYSKDPIWVTEDLFLNVLVEGNATLFSYLDNGSEKFFYEIQSENISPTQLIYRKYHISDNAPILENNFFRNQLNTDLKCDEIKIEDLVNLKYKKDKIIAFFKKYNACKKSSQTVFENKSGKKVKVRYSVFAGVYNSDFSVEYLGIKTDKESKITFGFGGEVAIVMPSEKIEFFLKAEYEHFSGTSSLRIPSLYTASVRDNSFKLESSFINVNIGTRYNFILGNNRKLYIDGSVGASSPFNDVTYELKYPNTPNSNIVASDIKTGVNIFFNFGIGYAINRKIAIDFRADTKRDLFSNNQTATSKFSRFGMNLRYSIN